MSGIAFWTSRLEEAVREYSRHSTMYRMVIGEISDMLYTLENIEKGWRVWRDHIPADLDYHGLDRGRIYDLVVEDYLSDREPHYVWLLANDASVTVRSEGDELTITLQGDTEGRYNISLHDMGGEVVLTYGNNFGGNKKTQRVDDYVASIFESSFESLECEQN